MIDLFNFKFNCKIRKIDLVRFNNKKINWKLNFVFKNDKMNFKNQKNQFKWGKYDKMYNFLK